MAAATESPLYRLEVHHHLGTDVAFYVSRTGALRAACSYIGEPFDDVEVVSVRRHDDMGGVVIWRMPVEG